MRARIAPLQNLIERHSLAEETLKRLQPGKAIESFGPFEYLETMHPAELDRHVEQGTPIVGRLEALAANARAEKERANQNSLTENDRLWTAIEGLTRRVAQLEAFGGAPAAGRQHFAQAEKPQMLMPPRGPVVVAPIGADAPGGFRVVGRAAASAGPETSALVPAFHDRKAGPGIFSR